MGEPIYRNQLSLLDQIRLAETDVARRIATARELAVRDITLASTEAGQIKKQAGVQGEHAGKIHYKEIVEKAEEQAHILVVQAEKESEYLRLSGQSLMEQAVEEVLNIILGKKNEGGIHES